MVYYTAHPVQAQPNSNPTVTREQSNSNPGAAEQPPESSPTAIREQLNSYPRATQQKLEGQPRAIKRRKQKIKGDTIKDSLKNLTFAKRLFV